MSAGSHPRSCFSEITGYAQRELAGTTEIEMTRQILIAAITGCALTSNVFGFDTVWENSLGNDFGKCVNEAKTTRSLLFSQADELGEPLEQEELDRQDIKRYELMLTQPGGKLIYICNNGRRIKVSVTY